MKDRGMLGKYSQFVIAGAAIVTASENLRGRVHRRRNTNQTTSHIVKIKSRLAAGVGFQPPRPGKFDGLFVA
jgi:hypothetical protein